MPAQSRGSRLPLVGLVIGLWAIIPPYVVLFGPLAVKSSAIEFLDHAVPGAVVVTVAVFGYFQQRTGEPPQLQLLLGGGVLTLAGVWMLSTHVGLITQARQGVVPGGAVAWHGLPGIAVTLFGVFWTACFWGADEAGKGSS